MKIAKKHIGIFAFLVVLAFVMSAFYYQPASALAAGSGPILSDNWFEMLNWIRNNTAECAVIATYWDPGHFITAIARRSVVFDGASQGEALTRIVDGESVTTSRIQDIATALFTSNESLSAEMLERYRKEGCGELYFLVSADLIGKSQWWSYFATWNPVDKGTPSNYLTVPLTRATPLAAQDTIVFTYAFGQQQSFVVRDQNGALTAFIQNGAQLLRIERLLYFDASGRGIMVTAQSPDVRGMLWMQADRQSVIFMPPELEGSMFTRLFFFDGQGLERFEPVGNWGGEVKLFRVKF